MRTFYVFHNCSFQLEGKVVALPTIPTIIISSSQPVDTLPLLLQGQHRIHPRVLDSNFKLAALTCSSWTSLCCC